MQWQDCAPFPLHSASSLPRGLALGSGAPRRRPGWSASGQRIQQEKQASFSFHSAFAKTTKLLSASTSSSAKQDTTMPIPQKVLQVKPVYKGEGFITLPGTHQAFKRKLLLTVLGISQTLGKEQNGGVI